MKRKNILTVEFERVRVITAGSGGRALFCEVCKATSEFVESKQAAELAKFLGLNSPEMFHFYQAPGNKIYICLNSIFENCRP